MSDAAKAEAVDGRPWWKQLSRYHWFVIIVASAAWFFDCLDQRLFTLARVPALSSLMQLSPTSEEVKNAGKEVTAWFLIGWGLGGMFFGSLGDKYGRAKTLTISILTYSAFTGLSFFSHSMFDFAVCRFLTGIGVGGVFGLAVSLIAETVPAGARTQSLGLLQVLSTIGNITAGLCKLGVDSLENGGTITKGEGWRWMFLIGAVPALIVIFTGRKLKEPESWLRLKENGLLPKGGVFSPYAALLKDARWRKNLIIGALIASTGVVGLWAIGEYAPDLQKSVFTTHFSNELIQQGKLTADTIKTDAGKAMVKPLVDHAIFWAYIWNMIGAGVGMTVFTRVAGGLGRRTAFAIGFSAALVITFLVYWKIESPPVAYAMMFMLGAAQLSVFAGFAIYLPELFPSRLRSTGTSFCYNLGRFAAAAGSFGSAALAHTLFGNQPSPLPSRYSAMTMCAIFLVGLITLPFAPETKGQPLPEE
ncbi:MAG: MFS transporter [Planctomycetota bacterium]